MEARNKRPAPLTPDLFRQDHVIIVPDAKTEAKLYALLQAANQRANKYRDKVQRLETEKRLSKAWTKVRRSVRLTPSPKEQQ